MTRSPPCPSKGFLQLGVLFRGPYNKTCYMSWSLNSLKAGYIVDYIWDHYRPH